MPVIFFLNYTSILLKMFFQFYFLASSSQTNSVIQKNKFHQRLEKGYTFNYSEQFAIACMWLNVLLSLLELWSTRLSVRMRIWTENKSWSAVDLYVDSEQISGRMSAGIESELCLRY